MPMRIVIAVCILLASGHFGGAQSQGQRLTVFAATSLTDLFEALGDAFVAANENAEIVLNFSSSSTLAAQLIQGAPADVFASANEAQMNLVIASGLIAPEAVEVFAHNQLVVITPVHNPAMIASPRDLGEASVLLVLAAPGTPIREYTDAMLLSYAEEFGGDFYPRVMDNLVSEESNVRQVATRVALGEADAGIVYQSDAIGDLSEDLLVINIQPAHNQTAAYPIAPLAHAANMSLAIAFINFALSADAQPLYAAYGFCSPAILSAMPADEATAEPAREADDSAETPPAACPDPEPAGL